MDSREWDDPVDSFAPLGEISGLDYSVLARMPSLEEVHAWDKQALKEIEATCPERDFELIAQGSAKEE